MTSFIDIDENYYLRRPQASDAQDYFLYYNEHEITKYLPADLIPENVNQSIEDISLINSAFDRRAGMYWFLANKKSNRMIGGGGFHDWSHFHKKAEIAYDIATNFHRMGIGEKMVRKIIDYGFSDMGLKRITATATIDNQASIKMLNKIGFKAEGVLKKYKFFKGNYVDIVILGMTA